MIGQWEIEKRIFKGQEKEVKNGLPSKGSHPRTFVVSVLEQRYQKSISDSIDGE